MTCKECDQRNPIGNKFCRECGAKIVIPEGSLAAEEAARAETERRAERGAILLSDAHMLAEQGKLVAAVPVAEEAVATLPFSVSALTLLVTLYEHTDRNEKAVAAQERIVALVPNAVHEATRLERLKRGERTSALPTTPVAAGWVPTLRGAAPATVPVSLPQWFPVAAGMVGGGIALYLGFLAMSPGKPGSRAVVAPPTVPIAIVSPTPTASEIPVNPGAMLPPAPDPVRGADPFVSLDATRRQLQQPLAGPGLAAASPGTINAGASLPLPKPLPGARNAAPAKAGPVVIPPAIIKVSRDGGERDTPLPPIAAGPPTGNGVENGFGGGERVAAAPPPAGGGAPAKPTGGYMKITVNARPQGSTLIPAAPPKAAPPDMETDPLQQARAYQNLGRYKDAIDSYQAAISAGAPVGETQQAIALCHQRAGDTASAKVAYIQAIAAYKAQIAAGRSPSAAVRGKNTCEAALEVLNGD